MKAAPLLALVLLPSLSCRSPSAPDVVDGDPAHREALLGAVAGLEGTWEATAVDGTKMRVEFAVTSDGTAVRELMFPGTPHEMTNMYTLDGNALRMTHYCAGGNQPRMRATGLVGNQLAFDSVGVGDLNAPDETYMGEMTLVFLDEDHVEERWTAFKADMVDHALILELTRVR